MCDVTAAHGWVTSTDPNPNPNPNPSPNHNPNPNPIPNPHPHPNPNPNPDPNPNPNPNPKQVISTDGLTPGWGVEDLNLVGGWSPDNPLQARLRAMQPAGDKPDEFFHHHNWVSDNGWKMVSSP